MNPICEVCCLGSHCENARLRIEIAKLRRRLKMAKIVAENIKRRTQDQMDDGNLQRARWAYIKGAHVTAAKISKAL